jgi:D-ribose pyranase
MKKIGILNKEISDVIAGLGHTDQIIICDAGFPIPQEVRRIDLALEKGLPSFLDTLRVISKELCVEKIIVEKETKEVSPKRYEEIIELFPNVEVEVIPHVEFKEKSKNVKAIIRTGEFTPYSNLMLISGVIY